MGDRVFKGAYSIRKHRLDMHFPAKYRSVVPTSTAVSGVRGDRDPDLRKLKLVVGNVRSKIPIASPPVALIPIK